EMLDQFFHFLIHYKIRVIQNLISLHFYLPIILWPKTFASAWLNKETLGGFTRKRVAPRASVLCKNFDSDDVEYIMTSEFFKWASLLISWRHCVPFIRGILRSIKI